MPHSHVFPFSALVGQEKMKLALVLNVIDPTIDGVLIRGEKGTAKSTAVRALAQLLPEIPVVADCPFGCHPHRVQEMCAECRRRKAAGETLPVEQRKMQVLDLPVGATEDRVVGSLDIEHALQTGEKRFEPGLLARVNRGILYVDEVNLLEDHIVDVLLDVAAMGVNHIEREGVSYTHPSQFVLVGTMNPEEGELRPQLLDRFGLCVEVRGIRDPALRVEVMKRRQAYEADPQGFRARWAPRDADVRDAIVRAEGLLGKVRVTDEDLEAIANLSVDLEVDGHRADLALIKTVRALAAFRGRTRVTDQDIAEAAALVYPHRLKKTPFEERVLSEEEVVTSIQRTREAQKARKTARPAKKKRHHLSPRKKPGDRIVVEQRVFSPAGRFGVRGRLVSRALQKHLARGRRVRNRAAPDTGRYVRARLPAGRVRSLALDATLRAAAPEQVRRRRMGLASARGIRVLPVDFREKVHSRRSGVSLLFAVDASGSMGVEEVMAKAKGIVLSLLADAYQKRDRVGLLAFRGTEARLVLPFTTSVNQAQRRLRDLPTGGKSPLALALAKSLEALYREVRAHPGRIPLLVLLTDGKANISMAGRDPFDEALEQARRIRRFGVRCLVVDTDLTWIHSYAYARVLAEAMGARCLGIRALERGEIIDFVSLSG